MDRLRILAVDDSKSLRQMVSFTLRAAGFDVIEAEDGQEALEIAQADRFNLVLTDQNMPRMDGLTLVRSLRALPAYRTAPILMLTTESSDEMKALGRDAGATGWIVKPFNPDRLVEIIRKVTGPRAAGVGPRAG
jgi:two-component system chemotaxis response regulator CheY